MKTVEEIINYIHSTKKEYKKELKHWSKESSFYYGFIEKINTLEELEKYINYKTQSGNEKMCFKTTFLDWIYKGELKEKKNKEPIKIDKDLYDWITMWSLSRNETFNQTLNHLLREKMNSDTKDYTDKIDKLMKGEYL